MTRLIGALVLLIALLLIQLAAEAIFPLLVSLALLILPSVNLAALILLAWASSRAPKIVSLRSRAYDAMFLAIASFTGALLGALVVGRALNILPVVPRGPSWSDGR